MLQYEYDIAARTQEVWDPEVTLALAFCYVQPYSNIVIHLSTAAVQLSLLCRDLSARGSCAPDVMPLQT